MSIHLLLIKFDFLASGFNFKEIPPAESASHTTILEEIYKLRYEVYCLECNYLSKQCCHADTESDEYDDYSTHFAAYTSKTNTLLGTARLIQPAPGQLYPFQKYCSVFDGFSPPPPEKTVEVSRLVVKKNFRRSQGHDKRLLLGIYKHMYLYSRQNGICYWYAAMEDSLAHSLNKMGFKFSTIGAQADYYGPIKPYLIDMEEMMVQLRKTNPFLAAWMSDEPIPIWLWVKTAAGLLKQSYFRKKRHVASR